MSKNHYRVIDWHKFSGRPRDAADRYTVVGIQDVELSGERGKQIEAATVYHGGSGDVARSIADHTRMELESVRPYIWWDNDKADELIAMLREQGHRVYEKVRDHAGFMLTPERSTVPPYLNVRLKNTKMQRPDNCDTCAPSMEHLILMVEVGAEEYVNAERGQGDQKIAARIFRLHAKVQFSPGEFHEGLEPRTNQTQGGTDRRDQDSPQRTGHGSPGLQYGHGCREDQS